VNIFTCWVHVLVLQNFDADSMPENGYVENMFFNIITLSTVGYGIELFQYNPTGSQKFNLCLLFIQLFGMIFYGWIIGYTLSNLQRINKVENWANQVKSNFSSWLVFRDDNMDNPLPLKLFEEM